MYQYGVRYIREETEEIIWYDSIEDALNVCIGEMKYYKMMIKQDIFYPPYVANAIPQFIGVREV